MSNTREWEWTNPETNTVHVFTLGWTFEPADPSSGIMSDGVDLDIEQVEPPLPTGLLPEAILETHRDSITEDILENYDGAPNE